MNKTFEMLAGGLAAMLFATLASAQVNPPMTNGAALQPIQPPPPVRLPPAAQPQPVQGSVPQAPMRPVQATAQPAVPVAAQAPVATRTLPQQATAANTAPVETQTAAPAPAAMPQARDGDAFARIAPPPQFGDMTRGLMALQASGRAAGKPLAMQEPVAQAAWQRYIKSFDNKLPQWFGERVRSGGSGGSSGGSQ